MSYLGTFDASFSPSKVACDANDFNDTLDGSSANDISPDQLGEYCEVYNAQEQQEGANANGSGDGDTAHMCDFDENGEMSLYLFNDTLLVASHERISDVWGRAREAMKSVKGRALTVTGNRLEVNHGSLVNPPLSPNFSIVGAGD